MSSVLLSRRRRDSLMLPLRHLRYWQIASVLILLLVLAATLMPAFWFWGDKSSGFGVVQGRRQMAARNYVCSLVAVVRRALSIGSHTGVLLSGFLLFGLAIEVCQRMVGYRTAEWLDVGADMAGILLGLAIARCRPGWLEPERSRGILPSSGPEIG